MVKPPNFRAGNDGNKGLSLPDEDDVVYVVDEDQSVRESLERLLDSVRIKTKTFESADRFMRHDRPLCPSCIVLAVRFHETSGLEVQEQLRDEDPPVPIIFLTEHGDVSICAQAMKSGAVDFLTKPHCEQALLDAVHRALRLSRRRIDKSLDRREALERMGLLTPRERQVFRLVVKGLFNRQIGERLGTTEKTVKVHRGRVMRKLDAWSVVELLQIAARIEPSD